MKMMDLLFIIFSEEKVNSLLNGFKNIALEKFEEGTFPRKLFIVVNEKK